MFRIRSHVALAVLCSVCVCAIEWIEFREVFLSSSFFTNVVTVNARRAEFETKSEKETKVKATERHKIIEFMSFLFIRNWHENIFFRSSAPFA